MADLLIPLAQASLPKGGIFDIRPKDFTQDYLISVATSHSSSDNAKVSLILEAMLKALMVAGLLYAKEPFGPIVDDGSFGAALEEGIKARETKATGLARSRKGVDGDEERLGRDELERSSRRLMALLEAIEESE